MDKRPTHKLLQLYSWIWTAPVVALLLLLTGCATPPPMLPSAPVRNAQIPALPTWARQPATPSECLPTCSDGLTSARDSWQTLLTDGTSPAAPVSASTTGPTKP